ncbi:MAG: chromosomal replication initiator protein DnaA [Clostridia bacterium]|nr:chromosomal replication initiator protein DnaA [Clostridia bacterium]
MQAFKNVWQTAVDKLETSISETAMTLWIKTIQPIIYENDSAVLLVESPFHRDIIMSKYRDLIRKVLTEIVGFEMDINVVTPEDKRYSGKAKQNDVNENLDLEQFVEPVFPEYTFDNFIVGDSNKHAHAACIAVAKNPAKAYNPLFLYGNTGLGKTHLLYAIKNEIKKTYPNYKTLYIKSEDFTNDLIEYIGKKNMQEFKNKYRSVDVLLVDDIQFIAGKDSTQDEFFHTFNALYEANKQIILASDRPPRDIQLLESRLRSRFESGIITDIYMPEYELKVAIIKQKAISYNISLPEDVIDFVAQRIKNNIRQLEGVLKKIMAFQLISKSPPNIAIAQSAIRDITNENEPLPIIVDKVITEVSREFEVSPEDIKSKKRIESITFARQVSMFIMREITDMSLPEIGQQFNGRDHSTVHHAIKKIEDKITMNNILKSRINDIIKNIRER